MNRSTIRVLVSAVSLLLVTALIAGCAHTRNGAAGDVVSGYYAGHWYLQNPNEPAGELYCTITPVDVDSWDALFVATFGERGEYRVPLEGHRIQGKVVFEGAVDLGASQGGTFEWTGEIVDGQFNGQYSAARYTGTFRMTKTDPPAE